MATAGYGGGGGRKPAGGASYRVGSGRLEKMPQIRPGGRMPAPGTFPHMREAGPYNNWGQDFNLGRPAYGGGGRVGFEPWIGPGRSGRAPGYGGGDYGFGGPPGPGNIEYGRGGFGYPQRMNAIQDMVRQRLAQQMPGRRAGYFGGGEEGLAQRGAYQDQRQALAQQLQSRLARQMQMRAMMRMMQQRMGGGGWGGGGERSLWV